MSAIQSLRQHPDLADNPKAQSVLSQAATLPEALREFNHAYRAGDPLVSDYVYDAILLPALVAEIPEHPFLHAVEPEPETDMPLVRHAQPMLSTAKAYTQSEVDAYLKRVSKAAMSLGIPEEDVHFRLTAKLDGIAVHDDGQRLVTRGDGLQGRDISHILGHGVIVEGDRGMGAGELVCDASFFKANLGPETNYAMDHSRNFVAGFAGADTVKPHHQLALSAGAIRFVPFTTLPTMLVTGDEISKDWQRLYGTVVAESTYDTDGMVVSVASRRIHEAMGATNHHQRAVLAIKERTDTAESTIEDVRLTTGRTGRIIPTLLIRPVSLSGATVSKVTAHTAKNLMTLGLGAGAVGVFTRSGEVIPYLCNVIKPADKPMEVTHCPSCGTEAVSEGEHLICPNSLGCQAQAEAKLRHWFQTIGNIDLFGPKTITTLVDADITSIERIYAMTVNDFAALGFGPVQSKNLVQQLERSLTESVSDWRFLASFGIPSLGRGDARRLLGYVALDQLGAVTASQIANIEGFGPKTSPVIARTLSDRWDTIAHMLSLGFNLERTPLVSDQGSQAPAGVMAGERVVFTGTMTQGKRKDMEANAAALGAEVQSSVNGQTTMLVIGEKAGSKLSKAKALNEKAGREVVQILREADYLTRIQ